MQALVTRSVRRNTSLLSYERFASRKTSDASFLYCSDSVLQVILHMISYDITIHLQQTNLQWPGQESSSVALELFIRAYISENPQIAT